MNRRRFLKQSALFSLGGLLLPSALLSSCKKDALFEEIKFDGKVLIIGAGAAGLYAGYLLVYHPKAIYICRFLLPTSIFHA